jgi:hypothetical protein
MVGGRARALIAALICLFSPVSQLMAIAATMWVTDELGVSAQKHNASGKQRGDQWR